MPHLARASLVALALLCLSSQASAQPRDPAREAFEQGVAALEGGRTHDALLLLLESQRLAPFPVVLYNLGLCYRSLGRTTEAVDAFERFAAAPEPDTAPALLDTVRAEVARMRALMAVVRVTVSPAAARVTVDGRSPDRSIADLLLTPGVHVIEASAPGYRAVRREVDLDAGRTIGVTFALVVPARIFVTPSVSEAIVSIDGRLQGIGPTHATLEPGPHRVEVRASGYGRFERTLNVEETGQVQVDAALTPLRPPERNRWLLPTLLVSGGAVIAGAVILAVVLQPEQSGPANRWDTISQ